MSADVDDQWTLGTLYVHFTKIIDANDVRYDQRFEASQSALDKALTAQQTSVQAALTAQKLTSDMAQAAANQAVTKAETASEKRFDSVNEFRNTLADQQRTLMPRTEAEILIKQLNEKIDNIQLAITANASQKVGAHNLWGYLVGAAGIVLALIFHFVK